MDDVTPPRGPSRRTAILGGIGAAVVAGAAIGGAVAITRAPHPPLPTPTPTPTGSLVARLLQTKGFTAAHRGSELDWPEMSFYGYQRSVARRVDALEISLARTSDGVWFGLHDATLDRTSETKGFVAADHTWAEVNDYRILANATHHPSQPSRPYLRFETLVEAYGGSHAIFVDPKSAKEQYLPELCDLMADLVDDPTGVFIAKGTYTATRWATTAQARGYESWGFYYASDLVTNPSVIAQTEHLWTILGMNYTASSADWALVRTFGKPVIAHVIPNRTAAKRALELHADGLMVSGVAEVLR